MTIADKIMAELKRSGPMLNHDICIRVGATRTATAKALLRLRHLKKIEDFQISRLKVGHMLPDQHAPQSWFDERALKAEAKAAEMPIKPIKAIKTITTKDDRPAAEMMAKPRHHQTAAMPNGSTAWWKAFTIQMMTPARREAR